MADKDTSGINKLRKLSRDVSPMPMWVCLRCGNEGDLGGYVNATVREVLNDLADQIERERAEELASARRERDEALESAMLMERREGFLADEAREAVERLRAIDQYEVYYNAINKRKGNWDAIEKAIGAECDDIRSHQEDLHSVRNRLIELIEHGGKRDVDVAALRELADDMDKRAHGAYGKTFVNASMYAGLMHGLSKRIRKAVEGAKEPEVLGADGEPIREGETVWDSTSPNDPTSSTVWRHGGPLQVLRRNDVRAGFVICENDQGIPLDCCAADLTHTPPDTQERIGEGKHKAYDAYWGCDANITCRECPALIAGLKPHKYYGVLNCSVAQGMDIARRKRELDAKTMGGAR